MPGYAKRRIEYQPNAVRVVCTVFSTIAATSSAAVMLVIVSQTSLNQPRMSQPRRFAAAPMTRITRAPTTHRFHRKRFAGVGGAAIAASLIAGNHKPDVGVPVTAR